MRGPITGLAILVTVVAFAAGCGGPATAEGSPVPSPCPTTAVASVLPSTAAPSPATSAATAADPVYDRIEEQVVGMRELQPTRGVDREVIDEARLNEMLTEMQDEDTPPAYVAANERLYKALGLLPEDADLRDLTTDLLTAGVLGFYRSDLGKMFIVSRSGEVGGLEKFTYAHEYTHALQDQHFPVFKDQDGILDQSDRIIARQAVYEGDASLLMTLWGIQNLSPDELLGAATINPDQQAVMDSMPAILRETLEFPYVTGLFYVQAAQAQGGWPAVDAFYERMPSSTEQILHAEKYKAGEEPIAVTLPCLADALGEGWSVPLEDTFGEFQLGIWLREGGAEAPADAAAGWGGDRLAVLDGPEDTWAVVMHSAWDSDADATEFEEAAITASATAGGPMAVLPGDGPTDRWVVIADGEDTLQHVIDTVGLGG